MSAPFPMLSGFNSNLVANSGFEENSDSHWDKWWGDIGWTNMVATTNVAYQGKKSMQITLLNQSGGAIHLAIQPIRHALLEFAGLAGYPL